MVGTGSFLPMTFLISRGLVDPLQLLVDKNTGALAPHYAAHNGHLKFLRWLKNYIDKLQSIGLPKDKVNMDVRDAYDCTLSHYAVRSGHLPVVMYNTDILKIPLNSFDKFGYNCLDYSIMYKKLYCFIYIYFCQG